MHLHFRLRIEDEAAQAFQLESELFFDEELTRAVNAQRPYSVKGQPDTPKHADCVYTTLSPDEQAALTVRATRAAADGGYNAGVTLGVRVPLIGDRRPHRRPASGGQDGAGTRPPRLGMRLVSRIVGRGPNPLPTSKISALPSPSCFPNAHNCVPRGDRLVSNHRSFPRFITDDASTSIAMPISRLSRT